MPQPKPLAKGNYYICLPPEITVAITYREVLRGVAIFHADVVLGTNRLLDPVKPSVSLHSVFTPTFDIYLIIGPGSQQNAIRGEDQALATILPFWWL